MNVTVIDRSKWVKQQHLTHYNLQLNGIGSIIFQDTLVKIFQWIFDRHQSFVDADLSSNLGKKSRSDIHSETSDNKNLGLWSLHKKNLETLRVAHLNINSIWEKSDILMICVTKIGESFPISKFSISDVSAAFKALIINYYLALKSINRRTCNCLRQKHRSIHIQAWPYFYGWLKYRAGRSINKKFMYKINLPCLLNKATCFKNLKSPSCIDLILKNFPHSFQYYSATEVGLLDFHGMETVMITVSVRVDKRSSVIRNIKTSVTALLGQRYKQI